jgi:hypothetical protein
VPKLLPFGSPGQFLYGISDEKATRSHMRKLGESK